MRKTTILGYRFFMVVFAIILLIVCLWRLRQDKEAAGRRAYLDQLAATGGTLVARARDSTGAETVRATVSVVPEAAVEDLLDRQNKAWEARLYQALRAQEGRFAKMVLAQRVVTTTKGGFQTALHDTTIREIHYLPGRTDTVYRTVRATTYADPWLTFKGVISRDTLFGSYKVRNDQQIMAYTKRKPWWNIFKKRDVYVTLKNNNPNSTTDTLQTVVPQSKKSFFSLF